tara:strand:+ start:19407 stop:21227 length:1821 start_codon:yes stop_codon:yes gene_type:complete
MCGITGFVNVDGRTPNLEVLQSMNDSIEHRGPDGSGVYSKSQVALGHRRLSIIDLSESGKQPMSNENDSVWLTFNGEIYNYLELSADLVRNGHTFKSQTDSEVIIHSYEDLGEGCVNAFNGMFAFAIWDERKQKLFAARDRIGIKPFYYFFNGKTFVFGSEIKALLAHPEVNAEPDRSTVMEYLTFSTNWGNRTWYKDIKQLEPGHYLTLVDGNLEVKPYWDLSFNVDYSRRYSSFEDELKFLLNDSVKLHLRSDVAVGAHLSGGIDSSSIVALASDNVSRLHTFSGAFEEGAEFDERKYIDIVANTFKTQHHLTIPNGKDLPTILPSLIYHLDEPVAGPGSFPQYHVCRLVQESGVKVVLGGQGGDELFGGYPPYYALAFKNMVKSLKRGGPYPPISELVRLPQYAYLYGVIGKMFQAKSNTSTGSLWALNTNDAEMIDQSRQYALSRCSHLDPFESQMYQHVKYYLPTLLHVEDRTSMACSIESRVPLLDYRLVEFASTVPSWMKVRQGTLKYLLRQSMRNKVPDSILDRKDKKGFPTPIGPWFKGDLAGWIKNLFAPNNMLAGEYVNYDVLESILSDHTAGISDHGQSIWKLVNLELWLRGLK